MSDLPRSERAHRDAEGQARASVPEPSQGAVLRSGNEGERQLKSVIGDLWEHSETLVRQELLLVKAEYEARMMHAKDAVQRGAIALGLSHAAYLTTLATLVLLLAQWLEPWIASLIIAIGASAGAFVFSRLGKKALDEATRPLERQQNHPIAPRRRAHS